MDRDRECKNLFNGKVLMFWLLPIFLHVFSLLFWYPCVLPVSAPVYGHPLTCLWAQFTTDEAFCLRLHSVCLPSLFGILCKPRCYCHVCRNLPPICRYMPKSLLKACKKKQLRVGVPVSKMEVTANIND